MDVKDQQLTCWREVLVQSGGACMRLLSEGREGFRGAVRREPANKMKYGKVQKKPAEATKHFAES